MMTSVLADVHPDDDHDGDPNSGERDQRDVLHPTCSNVDTNDGDPNSFRPFCPRDTMVAHDCATYDESADGDCCEGQIPLIVVVPDISHLWWWTVVHECVDGMASMVVPTTIFLGIHEPVHLPQLQEPPSVLLPCNFPENTASPALLSVMDRARSVPNCTRLHTVHGFQIRK